MKYMLKLRLTVILRLTCNHFQMAVTALLLATLLSSGFLCALAGRLETFDKGGRIVKASNEHKAHLFLKNKIKYLFWFILTN